MSDATIGSFSTFGELLKHLRRRTQMTQKELGIAVGYSETQITRLEKGQRQPDTAAVRARFVEALDLLHEPALARRLVELAEQAHGRGCAPEAEVSLTQSAPRASRQTNLPAQLTRFVGREREMETVEQQLAKSRLVTLTGSGGVGKTRLAIEVGGSVFDQFPDGVWLIELAPIGDPLLVPATTAAVLGLLLQSGTSPTAALITYLAGKQALLILDNCEHLTGACAELAEALLRGCLRLRILATSRESLRVPGETTWRVPSLETPDPANLPPLEHIADYAAVQLFIEHAARAQPDFMLTPTNLAPVAQICHRLDGIPLAIEMAAAQVAVLTVGAIAAGLDGRFALLTSGSRTALPRHQTLRAALDWSYDLLYEPERALLARLSVFAGGWTLEAAQAVCTEPSVDVLPLLLQLARKSLAVTASVGGQTRYHLLETVRQYAGERLRERAHGEMDAVRDRHLAYYSALAEETTDLGGRHVDAWLQRVEPEYDNMRAAFTRARARAGEDRGESMLRLAGALRPFWHNRGFAGEALAWLNEALARGSGAAALARARALLAKATAQGSLRTMDIQGAIESARAGLVLARGNGDRLGSAWCMEILAVNRAGTAEEDTQMLAEGALRLFGELDSRAGMCRIWRTLGQMAFYAGDFVRTGQCLEESLVIAQEIEDLKVIVWSLNYLYAVDPPRAIQRVEQAIDRQRQAGGEYFTVLLGLLGLMLLRERDYERACAVLTENLECWRQIGRVLDQPNGGIAFATLYLGLAELLRGNTLEAISLLNRAVDLWQEHGAPASAGLVQWMRALALSSDGEVDRHSDVVRQYLKSAQFIGLSLDARLAVEHMAEVARRQGQIVRATRLLGARAMLGRPPYPLFSILALVRVDVEQTIGMLRAELGETEFECAWAEGQQMSLEQAVEYALSG